MRASQGDYILGPEDGRIRVGRALAVYAESTRNLVKFHRECGRDRALEDMAREAIGAQVAFLKNRIAGAEAAGADSRGFNLTNDVIPYAARLIFADPCQEHEIKVLWRTLSGDAHAFQWPTVLRTVFAPTRPGDRLTAGTTGGDMAPVAEAFEAFSAYSAAAGPCSTKEPKQPDPACLGSEAEQGERHVAPPDFVMTARFPWVPSIACPATGIQNPRSIP